jgi:hypothetical protein
MVRCNVAVGVACARCTRSLIQRRGNESGSFMSLPQQTNQQSKPTDSGPWAWAINCFHHKCNTIQLCSRLHRTHTLLRMEPAIYAAACRWIDRGRKHVLETWSHALTLSQPLPTLPLWLTEKLAVPLELEATYEETCRVLRIG